MLVSMRVSPLIRASTADGRSGTELALSALREGTNVVAFAVSVVDAIGQPGLLVAPEERWAVVNVAALTTDKAPADVLGRRLQRELWRATCYVMGSANSTFPHCAMKPVFRPSDLDSLALMACPEAYMRMQSTWEKAGMHPVRMAPYRRAVEEGWAPQPTNDIQRTVWDEVHRKRE
jgi:hypothetical protein